MLPITYADITDILLTFDVQNKQTHSNKQVEKTDLFSESRRLTCIQMKPKQKQNQHACVKQHQEP